MLSARNTGQLLREFEAANRSKQTSSYEFIKSCEKRVDELTQIALIAIDFELSLKRGAEPALEVYDWQFAHLGHQLREIYADTVQDFVSEHCPIRYTFGSVPISVGEYDILREVGRGGMGVVYEAMQPKLSRHLAIKVLFLAPEQIVAEARSLAILRHPNICQVYDVDYIEELPVMLMQYIDGKQLGLVISEKPTTPTQGVELICKIALALAEAHENGIVHYDIKPSNILIQSDGEPILTDFGLAKSEPTARAPLFGSPSFLAPEQLDTDKIEQPMLCDVYSLGTVLYEILTGRRAFAGSVGDVINQVRFDPPRRPTDYRNDINSELEAICLRAMHKTPSSRYPSMLAFYKALAKWLIRWKD